MPHASEAAGDLCRAGDCALTASTYSARTSAGRATWDAHANSGRSRQHSQPASFDILGEGFMPEIKFDVSAIGNAIVDIIGRCDDAFLAE
ncbi:MAG: hypothetical protein KDJ36_15190, partial [Hyphomicrobiaceae bacterium]|nr:hypothetical protein [Hyphomicrobiaceae bacterium]